MTSVLRELADLSVWPSSAREVGGGDLAIGGVPLAGVAESFGTPAYVIDEDEVRRRCRLYRASFPNSDVVYAAKAFLCTSLISWVQQEGLGLDVCSAGELELACSVGFPPERIVMHGNAKSPQDLEAAVRLGVGRVVVDNLREIVRLAVLVPEGQRQKVMVRIVPGIAAGAHANVRTGTEDQKFGLSVVDGSAMFAVTRILEQPRLELVGLHCHLGSQITSTKPYVTAVRRMVGFLARIRDTHHIALPELDLGGGHGVSYRAGAESLDIALLGSRMRAELLDSCTAASLPVPRITVEPGRAIVGPAGVALYRVLAVKRTGETVFVAVDGGMSDNPRPALYGVRYEPRLVGRASHAPVCQTTVVGRHCEAGDVIATDVPLPEDVSPGDLLAVPVAGAYHLSMASSYNLVGRPPVIGVSQGKARLLVRRESLADLSSRDLGL